jgi:hypothetical protein
MSRPISCSRFPATDACRSPASVGAGGGAVHPPDRRASSVWTSWLLGSVRMLPPSWAFSARTDSITLSRMMVVFRHIGFWSVRDTTYFFGAFIRSPNGSPGAIGSKASTCIAYARRPKRTASASSRISAPKASADVVVPIRHSPAAVLERSVTTRVFTARCLHRTVQRHELRENEVSHRTPHFVFRIEPFNIRPYSPTQFKNEPLIRAFTNVEELKLYLFEGEKRRLSCVGVIPK